MQTNNTLSPWLDVEAAAERYKTSVPTVYRWIKERNFPKSVKLSPGCARWRLSDLEAWENSRTAA